MQEMTAELRDKILNTALDTFGLNKQIDMMLEEMAELANALLKFKRDGSPVPCPEDHAEAILEEIADVQIMLDQMRLLWGDERGVPGGWDDYKIRELAKRLRMEEVRDG